MFKPFPMKWPCSNWRVVRARNDAGSRWRRGTGSGGVDAVANIKGVYWWDPCYHIQQHHGSYGYVYIYMCIYIYVYLFFWNIIYIYMCVCFKKLIYIYMDYIYAYALSVDIPYFTNMYFGIYVITLSMGVFQLRMSLFLLNGIPPIHLYSCLLKKNTSAL